MVQVRGEPCDYVLNRPLRSARGILRRRRAFLVRIRDGRHEGLGEAAPLPGWTESYSRAADRLSALSGSYRTWNELRHELSRLNHHPATRHGLHMAMTDWKARHRNCRLFSELGRRKHPVTVKASGVVGQNHVNQTREDLQACVDQGYRVVKVKIGGCRGREVVENLQQVFADLPVGIQSLRLDANGSFTLFEAERLLTVLEDKAVDYVEQPLPTGCRALTRELTSSVRLAWDEELTYLRPPGELVGLPVDVLIVKPMVLGGLDRALSVIDLSRQLGMETVLSTCLESAVGRWGLVHLAATRSLPASGLGLSVGPETDRPWPVVSSDGEVEILPAAGLGFSC